MSGFWRLEWEKGGKVATLMPLSRAVVGRERKRMEERF